MIQDDARTKTQYKDRLFKAIFSDKTRLLSLYNSLNNSDYTNPDDLEMTTIENVIYVTMRNDLSFLIDDQMHMYEQQSSYNPSMLLPAKGSSQWGAANRVLSL